jgi:hypothetical protein
MPKPGDEVIYRGPQFPNGHAVVVSVDGAAAVVDLDHLGRVPVAVADLEQLDESKQITPVSAPDPGPPLIGRAALKATDSDK